MAGDVSFFTNVGGLQASVSGGRALVYGRWVHEVKTLVWVDRKGAELGTLGPVGDYGDLDISPDGRRVAVSMSDAARGQNLDVWVLDRCTRPDFAFDVRRTDESRPALVARRPSGGIPVGSPGFYDLYRRAADGGPEEAMLLDKHDKGIDDISADGRYALYWERHRRDRTGISGRYRFRERRSRSGSHEREFTEGMPRLFA